MSRGMTSQAECDYLSCKAVRFALQWEIDMMNGEGVCGFNDYEYLLSDEKGEAG